MNIPKVLYVAAECKPYSKQGGVADVAGELPIVLNKKGVPITIITPKYAKVDSKGLTQKETYYIRFEGEDQSVTLFEGDLNGTPVLLVENKRYLSIGPYVHSDIPFMDDAKRFSFFASAILPLVKDYDIVHGNDWMTGYLFGMMRLNNMNQARVLTVHNIGYQGNMYIPHIQGWDINVLLNCEGGYFRDPHPEWYSVNPMRLALELAHMINAVSPNYALEIIQAEEQSRFFEGGKGLESICQKLMKEGRLIGILNGFNYGIEQPTESGFEEALNLKSGAKEALSAYFKEPGLLLGFVGRAVEQKFKLLTELLDGKPVMEHLLEIPGVNLGILATGQEDYEKFMSNIGLIRFAGKRNYDELLNLRRRPNYAAFVAFDKAMAAKLNAASDIFLMPSLFEPCGITQLEAMSSATPPLVRWTGGLKDTVISYEHKGGTGFGFDGATRESVLRNLVKVVVEATHFWKENPEKFKEVQRNAFNSRFTWNPAAESYIRMYEQALKNKL